MTPCDNRPNLFLIGAPKSGTTSMTHYLAQLPSVFFPRKELHYFATSHRARAVTSVDTYMDLFRNSGWHHKWKLDSSTLYMYFRESIANIISFNRDAHFIAIIRDPLTMIPSWFEQQRKSQAIRENAPTLEQAWEMLQDRKAGRHLPPGCLEPRLLYYDEIARYGDQLANILSHVPRSQLKIVFFDDILRDSRRVFSSICNFLHVECPENISFDKLNYRTEFRYNFLKYVYFQRWLRPTALRALDLLGMRLHFSPLLYQLVFKPLEMHPVAAATEMLIADAYRQDLARLEHVLNAPLPHWLGAPREPPEAVCPRSHHHVPPVAEGTRERVSAGFVSHKSPRSL